MLLCSKSAYYKRKCVSAPETSWLSFMFPGVKFLQLGPKGMGKWKKKRNCLYLPSHSSGEQLILGFSNSHYSSERIEKDNKTFSFPHCEPAAIFFSPSCPKNIEILILKVT